jgi:hypothetical protein
MDHLTFNTKVCFEVDEALGYVPASESPCEANFSFRSVILKGHARILEDPEEKIRALTELMEKYQPGARLRPLTKETVQRVGVVEIVADEMTGKESKPTNVEPDG